MDLRRHLTHAFMQPVVALLICASASGCAVVTVADAAVSVVATVVKTTVKVAAAGVNAVLPGDGEAKK
jgi:hypothetical protein